MIHAGIRNKATAESVSSRKTTPGSRQFFRETSSSVVRNLPPSLGLKNFIAFHHAGEQPWLHSARVRVLASSPAQGAKRPAARGREGGSACIPPSAENAGLRGTSSSYSLKVRLAAPVSGHRQRQSPEPVARIGAGAG